MELKRKEVERGHKSGGTGMAESLGDRERRRIVSVHFANTFLTQA